MLRAATTNGPTGLRDQIAFADLHVRNEKPTETFGIADEKRRLLGKQHARSLTE